MNVRKLGIILGRAREMLTSYQPSNVKSGKTVVQRAKQAEQVARNIDRLLRESDAMRRPIRPQ